MQGSPYRPLVFLGAAIVFETHRHLQEGLVVYALAEADLLPIHNKLSRLVVNRDVY